MTKNTYGSSLQIASSSNSVNTIKCEHNIIYSKIDIGIVPRSITTYLSPVSRIAEITNVKFKNNII